MDVSLLHSEWDVLIWEELTWLNILYCVYIRGEGCPAFCRSSLLLCTPTWLNIIIVRQRLNLTGAGLEMSAHTTSMTCHLGQVLVKKNKNKKSVHQSFHFSAYYLSEEHWVREKYININNVVKKRRNKQGSDEISLHSTHCFWLVTACCHESTFIVLFSHHTLWSFYCCLPISLFFILFHCIRGNFIQPTVATYIRIYLMMVSWLAQWRVNATDLWHYEF